MYYPLAQQEFESYLNGYDRENDRIKLKIIHTYGVVKQAEELAGTTWACIPLRLNMSCISGCRSIIRGLVFFRIAIIRC